MTKYRCTRNADYDCDCIGRDDITARQGYYIHAESEEEAWQKMAIRYPKETAAGFSVQDWSENSGRSVVILRAETDEAGLKVLVNQEGKKGERKKAGEIEIATNFLRAIASNN